MTTTLSIAFLAGFISFLSPCVLPLIPGYISYISGQKIGQRLQGSELKTLLALFMLLVGLFMAYDTFFRNGTPSINIPTDKIVEISEFGNTIFNLSIKYPIVYGFSSIFLALVAGVAVSFIRREISRWKSERMDKPAMY